jgi:hypothetical protein
MRYWESRGIIPEAPWTNGSEDPRGFRRYYTRDQVMAIRLIAIEEGLLLPDGQKTSKKMETGRFAARVRTAWELLET